MSTRDTYAKITREASNKSEQIGIGEPTKDGNYTGKLKFLEELWAKDEKKVLRKMKLVI